MVHFTKSTEAYIFRVLNLDITAPSVRPAAFANTEVVRLKSRCSSRIIPRHITKQMQTYNFISLKFIKCSTCSIVSRKQPE